LDGIRRFAEFAREDGYTNAQIAEAAGVELVQPMAYTPWTVGQATAAVRAFEARNGFWPSSRQANSANGLPSSWWAKRSFGSWVALVEASRDGLRAAA
jgi:hypothetical protein